MPQMKKFIIATITGVSGRFGVLASESLSGSEDWLASLPTYVESKLVLEIEAKE